MSYYFFIVFATVLLFNEAVEGGVHDNELGFKYFEGDIMLPRSRFRSLLSAAAKWPNGTVPFVLDSAYLPNQTSLILSYMDLIRSETKDCVRFVNRTTEKYYAYISSNSTGCSSNLGMLPISSQPQTVSLNASGCINQRNVIHELFHTLGFIHEQTRSDRDSYVKIQAAYIITSALSNFQKYDVNGSNSYGFPYDYYSIMQYPNTAFSVNKNATIVPNDTMVDASLMGGLFLSLADILEVKRHYGCVPNTTNTIGIALQSVYNGGYVVAKNTSLTASGTNTSDPSQQYIVSFNNDTTVSFKSIKYGAYLSVGKNGSEFLTPSQASVASNNEKFYMISRDFVSFYLKSKANGKYVTIGSKATLPLIANVTKPGSPERFFRTIL